MKKLLATIFVLLFLVGCEGLPESPPEPGEQADTSNIGGLAYKPGGSIPEGFAPPWDIDTKNYILQVSPDSLVFAGESEHEIKVSADLSFMQSDYALIWKEYYVSMNGVWVKHTFDTGLGVANSGWLRVQAEDKTTLYPGDLEEGSDNYVLAYACTMKDGAWKCGCKSNNDCGYWHIQNFDVFKGTNVDLSAGGVDLSSGAYTSTIISDGKTRFSPTIVRGHVTKEKYNVGVVVKNEGDLADIPATGRVRIFQRNQITEVSLQAKSSKEMDAILPRTTLIYDKSFKLRLNKNGRVTKGILDDTLVFPREGQYVIEMQVDPAPGEQNSANNYVLQTIDVSMPLPPPPIDPEDTKCTDGDGGDKPFVYGVATGKKAYGDIQEGTNDFVEAKVTSSTTATIGIAGIYQDVTLGQTYNFGFGDLLIEYVEFNSVGHADNAVTFSMSKVSDFCLPDIVNYGQSGILLETECRYNNEVDLDIYPCPNGCSNGACIYIGPICGNNQCEEGEADYCPVSDCNSEICPVVPCYSGSCPSDCQLEEEFCGDGICEDYEADEICSTVCYDCIQADNCPGCITECEVKCPQDCLSSTMPFCGDGICSPSENEEICATQACVKGTKCEPVCSKKCQKDCDQKVATRFPLTILNTIPLDTNFKQLFLSSITETQFSGLEEGDIETSIDKDRYSQFISFGNFYSSDDFTDMKIIYDENDAPEEEVAYWLHIPTGINDPNQDAFFEWALDFNYGLDTVIEHGTLADLIGKKVKILGKEYEITNAEVEGKCPDVGIKLEFYSGEKLIEITDLITTIAIAQDSAGYENKVKINGEQIEEAWARISGECVENDIYKLRGVFYRLTADAATGTDIYVGVGESVQQHLDEPEGMLGLDIELIAVDGGEAFVDLVLT